MKLDFPTIMVLLVVVSGAIWIIDAVLFAPRRRLAIAETAQAGEGRAGEATPQPPAIVEYARSFFPVFLLVLVLRSFVAEPFRIPSNSMMPTLLTGDFILVNKFTYGLRAPVLNNEFLDLGEPERGDVIVFRYPRDPTTPFIKRVVGVPGDRIAYYNKYLYINGERTEQIPMGPYTGTGSGVGMTGAGLRLEKLGGDEHYILVQEGASGIEVKTQVIPEGHYFVLGDNRDNSRDSRYWGTVPEELLIGKAFTIWMSWDWGHGINWQRIGTSIE